MTTTMSPIAVRCTPCPFCGSSDVNSRQHPNQIQCKSCGAEGPEGKSLHDAVDLWNARDVWSKLRKLAGYYGMASITIDMESDILIQVATETDVLMLTENWGKESQGLDLAIEHMEILNETQP